MKNGRPRKPTEALKLAGTFREGRHTDDEVKPPTTRPPMPERLSACAAVVWTELCDRLESMKLLASVDAGAIERYAELFVRWRTAEDMIREKGSVCTGYDKEGNERLTTSPYVTQANACVKLLLNIEVQFGLTPSARSGLVDALNSGGGNESGLDAFIGRRNA